MPAAIIPITGSRQGLYVLLEAALPGAAPRNIGVLLVDPATDRGWIRMLREYDFAEDPEVLESLQSDLENRLSEWGAEALLQSFEDSLSNALRISERRAVAVDAFTRVAGPPLSRARGTAEVRRSKHTCRSTACAPRPDGWVKRCHRPKRIGFRRPDGMQLYADLFVAHVVGHSMEPRIPDGSLNLFRLKPVGSRQGKILLIQRFGVLDETARYTVKRYTSGKRTAAKTNGEHEQIRLEPLNPEFEAWDAGPEDFAVVAEWVRVIE